MITNTFSILNGIGPGIERKLWKSGILTWRDFLSATEIRFLSESKKRLYDEKLGEALARLDKRDSAYFRLKMNQSDHWRLFETFSGDAVCLDIETNGLPPGKGGYTTVVGLYDGDEYTSLVKGDNLSADSLYEQLSRYRYLITFYGSVFDIPFLEKTLPGFTMDVPHFDLCFGWRSIGFKGGLKKLEGKLGISRADETSGLDGYDAVLLWRRAQRGDENALRVLVEYNREDTVNLMHIARVLYPRLKESTGIGEYM